MNSHELARKLLSLPDREIIASLDLSTCEDDAFKRAHSSDLIDIQVNGLHTITLIFEAAEINE
jgi:hypothetical protein